MQFSAREDIEAPIAAVFNALSDFEGFERAALRRGIDVVRTDRRPEPGPGMSWRALFTMRGKPRRMEITLQTYQHPSLMRFDGESRNLAGDLALELVEMSPRRTRVQVRMEVRALSLAARITLQSLRLAKARTNERFRARVREHARDIQARYRQGEL